jgi:hypothetical protein
VPRESRYDGLFEAHKGAKKGARSEVKIRRTETLLTGVGLRELLVKKTAIQNESPSRVLNFVTPGITCPVMNLDFQ